MNAEERFKALYLDNGDAVVGYCVRRLGVDDGNDAAADVFVTAWRRIDVCPQGDEARLWLFGVARRVVANKRRSQTGFISTLNGGTHVYKSAAQACTTLSPTEAEIHAATTAISNFRHSTYVLEEMGINDFPQPFTLQIDNATAEVFMEDTKSNSRLKNIEVRENWVLEMRDHDIVIPEHVSTHDNLADLFTKPLTAPAFKRHVDRTMWIKPVK